MKIVVNRCYGGFNLSKKATKMLGSDYEKRDNPRLVEVVETLRSKASGDLSQLEVVDIPDNATDWYVSDYDGIETVIYVVDGKIKLI